MNRREVADQALLNRLKFHPRSGLAWPCSSSDIMPVGEKVRPGLTSGASTLVITTSVSCSRHPHTIIIMRTLA
jgi:hypothetical protein